MAFLQSSRTVVSSLRQHATFDHKIEIDNDKSNNAEKLASLHYQVEEGIQKIFRVFGSDDVEFEPYDPIKLLEVNDNTVASGIMPISFGPSPAS